MLSLPTIPAKDAPGLPREIIAIAGAAVLLRVGIALLTHFTQEDFLITLRYAENMASGHGFVYNAGERVLGTTTPLYALLLALLLKMGLPAAALGKCLNILADGVLCVVVYRWLSLLGQSAAGTGAAFLIAVNPLQIRVAISGQESSLAALCGALIWLWYTERRLFAAYFAAAVLFLLRWDGLILIAVLTLAILVRDRRVPVREMAVFVFICAPWMLFAAWYFGSPIPVTLAAKATVYGWYFPFERFPQLHPLLYRLEGTPRYALMAFAALLGVGRLAWERRPSPVRFSLLPPVAWFVLYWFAFLVSKVILFEWYLVPPLFVYEMLAALGLTTLSSAISDRLGGLCAKPMLYGIAGILACCLGVVNVRDAYRYTQALQQLEDHLRLPLGLWLRAHSRAGDRVMLEPLGYIGYYSRLRVTDMTGLVTPAVLTYYSEQTLVPGSASRTTTSRNGASFGPGRPKPCSGRRPCRVTPGRKITPMCAPSHMPHRRTKLPLYLKSIIEKRLRARNEDIDEKSADSDPGYGDFFGSRHAF